MNQPNRKVVKKTMSNHEYNQIKANRGMRTGAQSNQNTHMVKRASPSRAQATTTSAWSKKRQSSRVRATSPNHQFQGGRVVNRGQVRVASPHRGQVRKISPQRANVLQKQGQTDVRRSSPQRGAVVTGPGVRRISPQRGTKQQAALRKVVSPASNLKFSQAGSPGEGVRRVQQKSVHKSPRVVNVSKKQASPQVNNQSRVQQLLSQSKIPARVVTDQPIRFNSTGMRQVKAPSPVQQVQQKQQISPEVEAKIEAKTRELRKIQTERALLEEQEREMIRKEQERNQLLQQQEQERIRQEQERIRQEQLKKHMEMKLQDVYVVSEHEKNKVQTWANTTQQDQPWKPLDQIRKELHVTEPTRQLAHIQIKTSFINEPTNLTQQELERKRAYMIIEKAKELTMQKVKKLGISYEQYQAQMRAQLQKEDQVELEIVEVHNEIAEQELDPLNEPETLEAEDLDIVEEGQQYDIFNEMTDQFFQSTNEYGNLFDKFDQSKFNTFGGTFGKEGEEINQVMITGEGTGQAVQSGSQRLQDGSKMTQTYCVSRTIDDNGQPLLKRYLANKISKKGPNGENLGEVQEIFEW